MAFMVFSVEVKKEKEKQEVLDPTSLAQNLRNAFKGQGDVEFFCIKKCQECYVIQGANITPYDEGVNLGKNVEIHLLDKNDQFVHLDELGRVKDKKICFRFHLYANGSTTQMVISNDEGIYYLPSYFAEAKKVEDMDEAKALWIKEDYSLGDSGSYY